MITIDIQIHGYRKGHQLLASSIVLSKDDQAVVDRLSDVAGPLRPKELFAPYLTTYPLPSGTYYVVAKTWQDLNVSRAGCVRTKSLLINSQAWSQKPLLIPILHILDSTELPNETEAIRFEVEEEQQELSFPSVVDFNSSELLEALFLEESKPIVVFDAPQPELIALRLTTALWPDIRRRFALSTFALSPRKIGGRDLDIVFAPSNAKARFSDWAGRRVDGRSLQIERHRWTKSIVRRVFEEPVPSLLADSKIILARAGDMDNVGILRIALLWDELFNKLAQTPTAALGLLDIANSGMVSTSEAMKSLEPRLVEAICKVGSTLPHNDAWDFVSAVTRKMKGSKTTASMIAVGSLTSFLAEKAPDGAINLLQQPDPNGAIGSLIHNIAVGLAQGVWLQVKHVLINSPMHIIARLISQSSALASRVAEDDEFIDIMGVILTEVDFKLARLTGTVLLPFLIEDRQLPAAIPIIGWLDLQEVIAELYWLRDANGFKAEQISTALIDRAREVRGLEEVRDALVSEPSECADTLLALTLEPVEVDVLWLLNERRLSETTFVTLLIDVLRRADDRQFATLLSDRTIAEGVISRLPDDTVDILTRAALLHGPSMDTCIYIIHSVLTKVDDNQRFEIASNVMGKCLRNRFEGDETSTLSMLIGIIGERLDCRWIAKEGLGRSIDANTASRNLNAFENAPLTARKRIVENIDEIAFVLQDRYSLDLTEMANDACARLMFDAEKTSRQALVRAAGSLLPSLFRARRLPVSRMIAALFPIPYQQLAKSGDVPESLSFLFSLFDWDRCKAARKELILAFMSSNWKAGDLALTAWRCNDATRILKQVAKSYEGREYLTLINNDLDHLDDKSRNFIKDLIAKILSDKSFRDSW